MRYINLILISIIALSLILPYAYAVPTTVAATGVTSKNLTFQATGSTTPTYWKYGTKSTNLIWQTENVSASGGVANTTESGLPLMANTVFYYKACDNTGCGATLSSTLVQVTPGVETTYGVVAHNISVSKLNAKTIAGSSIEPYVWVTGTPMILFGVLLFFVFTGLWLRQREIILPTIVGMIGSGMLVYQGANSVGIPPEFLIIAIGLVCVGLTGVVVGIFKK